MPPFLAPYRAGDTAFQHQVLEELEPLVFGMVRSLSPDGDIEVARRHTNALTLAFHLDASAGRVELDTPRDLRAYAHRVASARLRDAAPLPLSDVADEETGSMVYACLGLQLRLEEVLDEAEREAFAARLRGEAVEWPEAKLRALQLIEAPGAGK